MRIDQSHPSYDYTVVYLDNRVLRNVIAADDEEGWVDVPDTSAILAMAPPPSLDEKVFSSPEEDLETDSEVTVWESIPAKRKYGKVVFRQIPQP